MLRGMPPLALVTFGVFFALCGQGYRFGPAQAFCSVRRSRCCCSDHDDRQDTVRTATAFRRHRAFRITRRVM